jgi:PKD repeat protein
MLVARGYFSHAQTIYFSVPDSVKDRLWVNVFDPGISRDFDQLMSLTAESKTRFALFGGAGASAAPSPQSQPATYAEVSSGTLIAEKTFGTEPDSIGQWRNIAVVDPRQGEAVAGRRFFRLLIQGVAGDAGNVFDFAVSDRETRLNAPQGLEVFSYRPTVRVPKAGSFAELRFRTPDTDRLVIHNFDAAYGVVTLTTDFQSVPLRASGQDNWQTSEISLANGERNSQAAINFGGGVETPNDATFMVVDGDGKPVRIELPVRLWPTLRRPDPVVGQTALSQCGAMAFDASRSADAKGGRLDYLWRFGDGATAQGPAVRHDYQAAGRYSARLEIHGSSGQVGNAAATDFAVEVKAAPNAHIDAPQAAAAGAMVTFAGTGSSPGDMPLKYMSWHFNDGVALDGTTVSRRFDKPGRYVATLKVDDGSGAPCSTGEAEANITINAAPVAVVGSDHRVSIGEAISLDGSRSFDPDGRIVAYHWNFGDGATAQGATLTHSYQKSGTYQVTLSVTDDAGLANSTRSATSTVIVNAVPQAVAASDRSAAVGEPLVFDGSASHDPDGHLLALDWDFGDGSRGSGEKTTYAFDKPGTYKVTLMVRDDSDTDTNSNQSSFTVRVNDPPVASAGPDQVVTASVVSFDGGGSSDPDGKIARYDWDFGDGTTGSGPHPTHVYEKTGRYEVGLTVTDNSGTLRSSAGAALSVVVNARPIADPGPDRMVSPGQKIVFDASRSLDPDGDVADYHWEFRDGADAHGRIVSHAFEKPGVYPVRLTVKDDTGDADADDSKEARITVNAPPVADAGGDLIVAPGDPVQLSGANSFDPDGRIAVARWDFSDRSEPILGADVTRTFDQPGIYTARLTVTDNSGAANGSDSKEITIAVNHVPAADAGADVVTESSVVTFDGSGSVDPDGDALTYSWDFGDGSSAAGAQVQHTYGIGGTYPIILTVDDGKGLANSTARAVKSVIIHKPPVADAGGNRQVCTGDIITFDGSKSQDPQGGNLRYAWDFGDGTAASLVNPTKVYRKGGVYPVTLKVEDASDLPNNAHSDRISVKVDQGPSADAGPDIEACAMTPVHLNGSKSFDPNGAIKRFDWDFGDGSFAVGEEPSHVYERPGQYRVFLKVEGEAAGRCDPYSTDEMTVRILPGPIAEIDARKQAPAGMEVVFDGSKSTMPGGKITAWKWAFGDGNTAEGPVVRHAFTSSGRKTVTLTLVTDSASPTCTEVKAAHVIDINSPPLPAIAMSDHALPGEEVFFDGSASTDPDGAIAAYEWTFGDGEVATGVAVRHRFQKSGNYRVRLKVTDEAGVENSSVSAEKAILLGAAPPPKIELPEVACTGEEVRLAVTPAEHAEVKPAEAGWKPNGNQNGVYGFTRRFDRAGRYDVTVLTDDGQGAGRSRPETRHLHINRPPVSLPGPQRMICPGDTVSFDGSRSYDSDGKITRFRWDFGDGEAAEGAKAVHLFDRPGTYPVTLTVTDDTGSSCASTIGRTRIVVNAPPIANAESLHEAFAGGAADAALLDGSGSHDPDGQALSYVWELGDGTVESGERTRHLFRQTGEIPVKLTVTDTSGLSCGSASQSIVVKVRSRSPVANN